MPMGGLSYPPAALDVWASLPLLAQTIGSLFVFSLYGASPAFYFIALFCPGAPLPKQKSWAPHAEMQLALVWDGKRVWIWPRGPDGFCFDFFICLLLCLTLAASLWRILAFVINKSKLKKQKRKKRCWRKQWHLEMYAKQCGDVFPSLLKTWNTSSEADRVSPSLVSVAFLSCSPQQATAKWSLYDILIITKGWGFHMTLGVGLQSWAVEGLSFWKCSQTGGALQTLCTPRLSICTIYTPRWCLSFASQLGGVGESIINLTLAQEHGLIAPCLQFNLFNNSKHRSEWGASWKIHIPIQNMNVPVFGCVGPELESDSLANRDPLQKHGSRFKFLSLLQN